MWSGVAGITPGILPSALRANLRLFKIAPGDFVKRREDNMGRAVLIGTLELQHHITDAVSFKPFMSNRWARDVTAQAFEFMALIHDAARLGMQAKALRVNTTF